MRRACPWEDHASTKETCFTVSLPLTFSTAGDFPWLSSPFHFCSSFSFFFPQASHCLWQRQACLQFSGSLRSALAQTAHSESHWCLKDMEQLQTRLWLWALSKYTWSIHMSLCTSPTTPSCAMHLRILPCEEAYVWISMIFFRLESRTSSLSRIMWMNVSLRIPSM